LINVRLGMRVLISLLLVVTFALGVSAHARMYQWVDSESGNVRLSGEPPSWYRSLQGGPRVLVFEEGRLIDDTAISLPPEQRKAYREAAFLEVDLRREREAVKKLERAALREARRREEADRQLSAEMNQQQEAGEKSESKEDKSRSSAIPPVAVDGGIVEKLKALVSTWDRQNAAVKEP
jgi:Arc/MetJ family transcription regulator